MLVVAAAIYLGFAARSGQSSFWVTVELLGVAVYGAMGLRGHSRPDGRSTRSGTSCCTTSGRGPAFAPATYTIRCLSFDLLVAGYVAVVYGRRTGFGAGTNRPATGVTSEST